MTAKEYAETKLAEDRHAGDVIVAGYGFSERQELEIGDLAAAIDIAVRHRCAFRAGIAQGRLAKFQKVRQYLHHVSLNGMRDAEAGLPEGE